MFEKAIEGFQHDPLYCLWAAIAQYYQYQRCSRYSVRKKELAVKVERYAMVAIHKNKMSKDPKDKDLNAMFIMLKLILDLEQIVVDVKLVPKYTAEDLAVMIKSADDYIGYLAWAEICIAREKYQKNKLFLPKGNKRFAVEVLEEMIEFFPQNPEAYFRLWSLYKSDPARQMSIANKMFLSCTNYGIHEGGTGIEVKMSMNLIYAESLFKTQEYIQCFEFLQNEFSKFPTYYVLLYFYGKYVVKSDERSYFGSGISALQE